MYEDLVKHLDYIDDLSLISKAYYVASKLHKGQVRDSLEDYITHPVKVAKIIASMHGDEESICASLLHDTLEDTDFTKEDIEREFGFNIAFLVDGVTKERKSVFSNSLERNIYNSNKLSLYSSQDIRVMVIKLSDRLHNMSSLEYKNEESIIENSTETMNFYVPVSNLLGMQKMKRNLEDLAFKYLNNEEYEKILCIRKGILDYSKINYLKDKIFNYMKYAGINGKVHVKYDGVMESYFKIKNGIDKLFTVYAIIDGKYKLPFKDSLVKVVSLDEFNFLENGITSSFESINETYKSLNLNDELLSLNSNYTNHLAGGGL